MVIGLLADVISANRKLLEDLIYRVRGLEARQDRDEVRQPDAEAPRPLTRTGSPDRWER
jgi:hypothetical protein